MEKRKDYSIRGLWIGKKVECIKDNHPHTHTNTLFIKGEYYEITNISNNGMVLKIGTSSMLMKVDKEIKGNYNFEPYFFEYFTSRNLAEVRIDKIKSILDS